MMEFGKDVRQKIDINKREHAKENQPRNRSNSNDFQEGKDTLGNKKSVTTEGKSVL